MLFKKDTSFDAKHARSHFLKHTKTPPTIQAACSNLDFETGTTSSWTTSGNVAIVSAGTDFYGGFPLSAPGGTYSVKLGNKNSPTPSSISQTFMVTSANPVFTYKYAMVLLNYPHSNSDAGRVVIDMTDGSGNPIPCAHFEAFYSTTGGSGQTFLTSPQTPESNAGGECCYTISYIPWTTVSLDLTAYIGQSVKIVVTSLWCVYNVDWTYCYIDCACSKFDVVQSCGTNNATLIAPEGFANYNWSGPGIVSGQNTDTLHVNQPGTYSVTLTTVNGCTTTDTLTVFSNLFPVASIAGDTVLCAGESTTLTASGANNYLWSTGNTTATITPTPTGTTTYSVIVTNANGCSNTAFVNVIVNPLPIVSISGNTPICPGNSSTLLASGGTSYSWNPGGQITTSISITPSITTSYTVTATSANDCTAATAATETVNPVPAASFAVTTVCFNNATVYTDQSAGNPTQWQWNFGDGNISANQNPTHTYNAPGTYSVTLIDINTFGCMDTVSAFAVVHPLPVTSFSSTTVCIGNPTCYTDMSTISAGTINIWNWNFDDPGSGANNISNAKNPCHTYTTAGTFNVILTAISDSNCQTSITLPVTVLALPVAAFTTADQCLNAPTVFTNASSGAVQWNWIFGDGNLSSAQNPSHTYLNYGTYIVTQIASSAGGCQDTATDTVKVYPIPIVNFKTDTVCVGNPTAFLDLSVIPAGNITGWFWDYGDGNSSALQNPVHTYASSGIYNVTLTCTSNNTCVNSLPLSVIVHPLPLAEFTFSPKPEISLTDAVVFTDLSTGGAVSWAWNMGDNTTDTIQNPIHIYADTGAYVITLIVASQYGCMDTVRHSLEIKDFTFYIPNSFTPNGDGINEYFFGKGIGITEYEMWIFDRWGNMMFNCHINDLPQSQPCRWDGKVSGGASEQLVQEDVYVWKVHFTSVFQKTYDYIGTVTIAK